MTRLDETTTSSNKCSHVFESGSRCGAYAVVGDSFCIGHTDDRTKKIHASLKMKQAKKRSVSRLSVSEILSSDHWDLRTLSYLIKQIMCEFHRGDLEAPKAQLLGTLANAATRALSQGDLEGRLEELENRLKKAG